MTELFFLASAFFFAFAFTFAFAFGFASPLASSDSVPAAAPLSEINRQLNNIDKVRPVSFFLLRSGVLLCNQ